MAYYPKKPRLTHEEVLQEIQNRTSYPLDVIYQILWSFNDICKEALLHGVETPLGDIGFLTWKLSNPKKDVTLYNCYLKQYTHYDNVPGFKRPRLRINNTWQAELKQTTAFWDNPVEDSHDENDDEEMDDEQ